MVDGIKKAQDVSCQQLRAEELADVVRERSTDFAHAAARLVAGGI